MAIWAVDIIHEGVALLGHIVGGLGQLLDFRRAFDSHAEIAVGSQHQAQRFGHAQQSFYVLLEQLVQDEDAKRQNRTAVIIVPTGRRESSSSGQHVALGLPHVQPDEQARLRRRDQSSADRERSLR